MHIIHKGKRVLTAGILGLLIGVILGLTGAGGGILAVPALVIGLGLDMPTAAPVALIAVGLAALVGALDGLRKRQVRYKAALLMAGTGALCSGLGVRLAHLLPDALLLVLFASVMLAVGTRLAVEALAPKSADQPARSKPCRINPASGHLIWTPRCALTLATIGAATGVCAGMLGVGGGFIVVPAFKRFTDIPIHNIVATSLLLIALISLSAATGGLLHGAVVPASAWVFVVATVIGMVAGRGMAGRINARKLQLTFAGLTLAVSGVLLARTWLTVYDMPAASLLQ